MESSSFEKEITGMDEQESENRSEGLPRCNNEEAGCNHLVGAHQKGGGRCFAIDRVKDTAIWKRCKCKRVKKKAAVD